MIANILFDLDGTLVDTERVFLAGNVAAAKSLGLARTQQDFLPLVGAAGEAETALIAQIVGSANVAAFTQATIQYVDERLDHGRSIALPGADALLARLRQAGRMIGVVTSSSQHHLAQVLANTGWQQAFDWQVNLTHGRPKPAPDLYQHALKTAALTPNATIAVEDTPVGVQSALAAGLQCLQVPDLAPVSQAATAHLDDLAAAGEWIMTH
ncbi:HAD family hydrolase [Lacticaseibacillus baoqingensis]|uniref:HAD family hydrolase n=1 Tax=Lacticaseibacillus baoqingensis TaxID=2486013 RepID=A0ABW4E2T5_9LACO|nr:HAD family phosphatase [Lacticaseibacillus baoqingensis]